jgi:hypothetical protein
LGLISGLMSGLVVATLAILATACTGGNLTTNNSTGNLTGSLTTAVSSSSSQPPIAVGSKVESAVATKASSGCSADDASLFDRQEGEIVESDSLPSGLFVASKIELLLEKSELGSPSSPPVDPTVATGPVSTGARVIIREVIGSDKGAEIACSEGIEKFGHDFEMSMIGLVKFDTTARAEGSGFIQRQIFFFQNKDGFGAVVSNPGLAIQHAASPLSLRHILHRGAATLERLSATTYRLKYTRDRNGVRAKMVILLDVN